MSRADKPQNRNMQTISKYGDEELKTQLKEWEAFGSGELQSGEGRDKHRIGIFHYKHFNAL